MDREKRCFFKKKINLAMMIEDKLSFGAKPVHFSLCEVSGLRDSVLKIEDLQILNSLSFTSNWCFVRWELFKMQTFYPAGPSLFFQKVG